MKEKVFKNKQELIKKMVAEDASVLDIGFWGQGVGPDTNNWLHRIIKTQTDNLYGLDLFIDFGKLTKLGFDKSHYFQANAENFSLDKKFDVIFAGDLIEHLSNPGLFLDCCKRHLNLGGFLILTTPNCFNLFNLAGKIVHFDPVVNNDHTCFFTLKTIKKLLEKNNLVLSDFGYLYSLEVVFKRSWKQKFLDFVYWFLSKITNKYLETLVIIVR